jgi:hypothetical protein
MVGEASAALGPLKKSGQFLVRTHFYKNAKIPRFLGRMSGVLNLDSRI